MKRIAIPFLALATALVVVPARAQMDAAHTSRQSASKTDKSDTSGLSALDKKFVKKAAEGGLAEVEKGKIAADRGTREDVKTFGKHMDEQHTKANDELKSIASSKGIEVPSALDKSDRKKIDKLSGMTGEAFDKAYAKDMVKDHKADVALFEKEAKHGTDADLKAFAEKTLPTLKEHLRMAEDLAGKSKELPRAGTTGTTDSGSRPR